MKTQMKKEIIILIMYIILTFVACKFDLYNGIILYLVIRNLIENKEW